MNNTCCSLRMKGTWKWMLNQTHRTLLQRRIYQSQNLQKMSVPLLQWSDSTWWFQHVHRELNLIELNRDRSFLSFTRADSLKMFQLPLWLVKFDSPVIPLLLPIIFRPPACGSMHSSCYHVTANNKQQAANIPHRITDVQPDVLQIYFTKFCGGEQM